MTILQWTPAMRFKKCIDIVEGKMISLRCIHVWLFCLSDSYNKFGFSFKYAKVDNNIQLLIMDERCRTMDDGEQKPIAILNVFGI